MKNIIDFKKQNDADKKGIRKLEDQTEQFSQKRVDKEKENVNKYGTYMEKY